MYFALNKKFINGSFLNARHLNDIVDKIIEIGGYIEVKFSNRLKLCADKINQIIISINNLILQFPESNIQQLELLNEGDVLCALNLNTIVDKINEIIDYLNNKKEEVYGLTVNLLSSSRRISSSGGNFILSAYITKNRKFYTTNGILVISDLNYTINDDIITFTIPKNEGDEKTFNIKITSEYGEEDILLYQYSKEVIDNSVISLYVSTPQAIVSAGGEVVQYTASILKNGVNYTTQGLKSNSNYPYGIKETYVDDGILRTYTVTFDENLSFSLKNYVSTISSYGLEPLNVNVQQQANTSSDSIKVYASASKLNYNDYDTSMSFTYYAKVNGQIILDGVNAEIVLDNVGVVSTNTKTEGNSKITTYTIYKNNDENIKTLTVRASYNGHYSGNIIFTQQGKKSNEEETIDCNCLISNTSESTIVFTSTGGSKEVIFNNSCGKPLVVKNSPPDWILYNTTSNKLVISLGDNQGEERTGTIDIGIEECNDIKSTITVVQEKIYIVGQKGQILLSFSPIGDDNVVNDKFYLTGVLTLKFTVYCKKIGPDGLVPGDMSLSKTPTLNYDYGLFYYNSNIGTSGNNFTYEMEIVNIDRLENGLIFNIYASYNDNYNQSNTIQAEYSEDHATLSYVKVNTEVGEEHLYTLDYPITHSYHETSVMQDTLYVLRDYNSSEGYFNFECIRKVEGQIIPVTSLKLYYAHMFGHGATNEYVKWYTINTETIDGKYGISYTIQQNDYCQDRSLVLGLKVIFEDNAEYDFSVQIMLCPKVYLNAYGDYTTRPSNRTSSDPGHMVGCDGSYPVYSESIGNLPYSEQITYYATKYNNIYNSPYKYEYSISTSGDRFVLDSEGTVKLMFDEDSTALIDSVTYNGKGYAYVTLKPNNTNLRLELFFYLDYVDNDGNIIATSRTLDRTYERDSILLDTCN